MFSSALDARCHSIIHTHALAAASGNLAPIPGTGVLADFAAMTSMTIALARLFGKNISGPLARNLVQLAVKRATLRHPFKVVAKEIVKSVPLAGSLSAYTLSFAILESAGWDLVAKFKSNAK